jgi:hypothetical protein
MRSTTIAASPLQGHAGTPAVPEDPSYWWRLADPLRKVAGYLFLQDRVRLRQASRAFHAILCIVSDTTMERARLVCTMSRFHEVLARVWRMPGDGAEQSAALCALGARIPGIPSQHRLNAWNALLDAAARLPVARRGAMLAALVPVAPA